MAPWAHANLPSNWHLSPFNHLQDSQTWPTDRHKQTTLANPSVAMGCNKLLLQRRLIIPPAVSIKQHQDKAWLHTLITCIGAITCVWARWVDTYTAMTTKRHRVVQWQITLINVCLTTFTCPTYTSRHTTLATSPLWFNYHDAVFAWCQPLKSKQWIFWSQIKPWGKQST